MSGVETLPLSAVDVGMVIRHPDTGEWVRIVDYLRPTKYGTGVYAYVDPETGAYGGLLVAHDDTESASPDVDVRSPEVDA